jgi:hypothetical protein
LIILIVCVERLNLHIIIYLNVQNILVNEIFFFESYFSYWTLDLRKIYYYLAVLTLILIQILLFLRQCINIFRKVNDFHKIQTKIVYVLFINKICLNQNHPIIKDKAAIATCAWFLAYIAHSQSVHIIIAFCDVYSL